jgi:hypothetical protein
MVPAGGITIRNNVLQILAPSTPIAWMSTTLFIAPLGLVGIALCEHDRANDCLRSNIVADGGTRTAIYRASVLR